MRKAAAWLTALTLLLVVGGYWWCQSDRAATERAAWLSDPVSEDGAVTVAYSAAGFLNRDVRIVAYDFGSEDKVIEDAYADQILNGDEAEEFYRAGFRHVVSGNRISRIIEPRQASAMQNESGDFSAVVGTFKTQNTTRRYTAHDIHLVYHFRLFGLSPLR